MPPHSPPQYSAVANKYCTEGVKKAAVEAFMAGDSELMKQHLETMEDNSTQVGALLDQLMDS